MVLAPILKPLTMAGFLIQYYLLIACVLVKNLIYKLFRHPNTLLSDFSYCPIGSVHPHVFAHTRTMLINVRWLNQTRWIHFLNLRSENIRQCLCHPLENQAHLTDKMERLKPNSHSAWVTRLLHVMVFARRTVLKFLTLEERVSPSFWQKKATMSGLATIEALSIQILTVTCPATGSSMSITLLNTINRH